MAVMDENVEVIGRGKAVDMELDSVGGRDFTLEWWRDLERTDPIDFVAVDMKFARESTIVLDAESMLTPDGNECRVIIPAASILALGISEDWDLKYFFQGTDSTGHVMIIRGKARVV